MRAEQVTVVGGSHQQRLRRAFGDGAAHPVERRVVHELLKDDPEVETSSEGSEPARFVVVLPRRSAD